MPEMQFLQAVIHKLDDQFCKFKYFAREKNSESEIK